VRQNINPRFSREKGSFFDPKPQGKELLKSFFSLWVRSLK